MKHGGVVNIVDVLPESMADEIQRPEYLIIEDPQGRKDYQATGPVC